ncbi:protein kinase domain-containing protein [Streptomyces chartreusis]|uniref:serine/threonine-protein kinase n=1 Tax=Streptomyces chartreusis TaxID=1969 RepID=UPI00381352B1
MNWQDEKTPLAVGEYRIERRIGAGGMGVVFLAASPSGRRVALKVIREEFADDSDYRARFRHEIEAARQVSGAFTAPVVGADADADPPWMATQYFDAPTLSERVSKSGALGENAVWQLGRGLAEALRDIHRAGLVHRDLKPSNVLLTEDGPRVIDFGIARVLNAKPLTRTGKILGTVSFMAPEQLSAPRDVGAAADVFALGGVLTHAATGRGPFDGDTGAPPIAVAMKIVQDDPDLADVPTALRAIVEKCLHKDPATRPSPAELLALLQEKAVGAAGLERPEKISEPGAIVSGPRLRPWMRTYLLAAAAVVVVAVGVAAPVMWSGGGGRDRGTAKPSPSATTSSPPAVPAVEPVAAVRPKGWALWERKPATEEQRPSDPPVCDGAGEVLVCTESGVVAERLDVTTGRVIWSHRQTNERTGPGRVVGFAGETVLVQDPNGDQVVGFDVMTGDRLWSAEAEAHPTTQQATVITFHMHANGLRIDRRDARTGKVLTTRTLSAEEQTTGIFDRSDGVPLLLKQHRNKGFTTSVATLDPATLRTTKVIATFEEDPGDLIAADANSLSFLRAVVNAKHDLVGQSVTRVTIADGDVTHLPLQDPPLGAPRVQGNTLYLSRTDGTLASYNLRTARRNWVSETGGESPTPPVIVDGRVYSLAGDGRITCVDTATGKLIWQSAARRDSNASINILGSVLEPVVLDGVVYAGATTGSIFAVAPPAA